MFEIADLLFLCGKFIFQLSLLREQVLHHVRQVVYLLIVLTLERALHGWLAVLRLLWHPRKPLFLGLLLIFVDFSVMLGNQVID